MLHQHEYVVGGTPVINPSHMVNGEIVADQRVAVSSRKAQELSSYRLQAGDVVMARRGEVGRAALVRDEANGYICGTGSFRVRFSDDVCREFIMILLRSQQVRLYLANQSVGTTMTNLNHSILNKMPTPVPPAEEQRRIVAKVDELMALCDQLEKARELREATRDQFVAATLARLNDPDPETFHEDAKFALGALTALTTRPDQIKKLRQTILNLAVRGKLVPQDPNDEPASELLKRISAEKRRSRGSTVMVGSDAIPFPIPISWKWAALDELITSGPQNGISPKPTTRTDAPRAITLTATTSGVFNPNHFKRVEATIPSSSDLWLQQGDLLFQRGNTREYVGIAAIYEGPPTTFLFPDLMMRVRLSEHVNLRYVHLAAISPPARAFLSENASGAQATMPKINQTTLVSLPLPIPPLDEQHRIFARVNDLMMLCDQLEESLAKGDDTRRRLLDALLVEALAPVKGREMQAAE
jgi:type I restriction enzyme S subunit